MTRWSARRFVVPPLALAGAAGALAYGALGLGMPWGAPLAVLGLGGLVLVLAGATLHGLIAPWLAPEAAVPEGPRTPARLRDLERDKQAVLKSIREIELDHQMRKLGDADHREMLDRARARAMRILRELDAGDDVRALIEEELKTRLAADAPAGGKAAAGTARTCQTCGAGNDADAAFCKKCGRALAEAGA